jgi:RecA/RadA recombinase
MSKNNNLDFLDKSGIDIVEEFPTTKFIDTGSYALNAQISGSMYKGIPGNRITGLAGMEGTGKTFFAMGIAKNYLDTEVDGIVVYFDTEFALEKDMLRKRGLDADRVKLVQPSNLQDFRTKIVKLLDAYEAQKKKPPMMIILDSLGNLPTQKEVDDAGTGKDVRDMSKSQVIKSIFRIITQKLGRNGIPMIITNHVYEVVGAYMPTKEMSGGSGFKYAASTALMLTKSKDRDGNTSGPVIGNIVKSTTYKSRYSQENQKVELRLDYKTGLDRYYGLIDIAVDAGIWTRVANKIEVAEGERYFEKHIRKNATKFFTPEVMEKIEKACFLKYSLGEGVENPDLDDETDTVDIDLEEIDTIE